MVVEEFFVVFCYFIVISSVLVFCYFVVFFFQAEDGIRDLVRSRGLGDVYKRQLHGNRLRLYLQDRFADRVRADRFGYQHQLSLVGVLMKRLMLAVLLLAVCQGWALGEVRSAKITAVSYTHLTLPTRALV